MRRRTLGCFAIFSMFLCLFLPCLLTGQDAASPATATCNFDADKQLVVHYQPAPIGKKGLVYGKPWAPGGQPLTLFTNAPVEIGGKQLSMGAYTMFLLPNSKQWTLIVSRDTNLSGNYDEAQDVVRTPMDSGELPMPVKELNVSFGHIAPDQCSIRIDFAKAGYFTVFQAK